MNVVICRAWSSIVVFQITIHMVYVWYCVVKSASKSGNLSKTSWEPSIVFAWFWCQTLGPWTIEGLVLWLYVHACVFVCANYTLDHCSDTLAQRMAMFHTDSIPNPSLGTSQWGKLGQSIVVWRVFEALPFASTRLWLQKRLTWRVRQQSPLHEQWCEHLFLRRYNRRCKNDQSDRKDLNGEKLSSRHYTLKVSVIWQTHFWTSF